MVGAGRSGVKRTAGRRAGRRGGGTGDGERRGPSEPGRGSGQLDEAEQGARNLLAHYPDVHDGFERLAMVAGASGDGKQAAKHSRKALAVMEENADNHDSETIDWMSEKVEPAGPGDGRSRHGARPPRQPSHRHSA